MGENAAAREEEIASLRLGLDQGAKLIDTAEMYGDGRSETLIGAAIAGRRADVFLVSKVYPHNASRRGAVSACERSLRRLKTDYLDLYLLHWRGAVPLPETMAAFQALQQAGKIRHYGVSNFDLAGMDALAAARGANDGVQTNQVLYNLCRRGIEWDLLPRLRAKRIPVMAYSPLEQNRLLAKPGLVEFARRFGITPAQSALAWLLKDDDIIVIPKSAHRQRLKENLGALEIRLDAAQLAELDRIFPPPSGPHPLEML